MTISQRIEQMLVHARRQLLEFGEEIGRESEAVVRACDISEEIWKATALLFATDDSDQADTLLSRLQ